MNQIRVILADDHGIVRAGIKSLIRSVDGIEIVGEAADGEEALEIVRQLEPDVAVVDIEMPGIGGIEATRALRRLRPATRVLILTMHDDPAFVRSAIDAGAAGFVAKDAVGAELIEAIRTVHDGRTYLTVAHMNDLLAGKADEEENPEILARGGERPEEVLSEREIEVLQRLALGHTNREIGKLLHLSHRTVATYRARLAEKLTLRTRAELVRYALRHGLIADNLEESEEA